MPRSQGGAPDRYGSGSLQNIHRNDNDSYSRIRFEVQGSGTRGACASRAGRFTGAVGEAPGRRRRDRVARDPERKSPHQTVRAETTL